MSEDDYPDPAFSSSSSPSLIDSSSSSDPENEITYPVRNVLYKKGMRKFNNYREPYKGRSFNTEVEPRSKNVKKRRIEHNFNPRQTYLLLETIRKFSPDSFFHKDYLCKDIFILILFFTFYEFDGTFHVTELKDERMEPDYEKITWSSNFFLLKFLNSRVEENISVLSYFSEEDKQNIVFYTEFDNLLKYILNPTFRGSLHIDKFENVFNPLVIASALNHISSVQILLNSGAYIDANFLIALGKKEGEGWCESIVHAFENGSTETFIFLFETEKEPYEKWKKYNFFERSLLFCRTKIAKFLSTKGFKLEKFSVSITPLCIAFQENDEEMVEFLLSLGHDPNEQIKPMQESIPPPLYWAIEHSNKRLTKVLLERGVSVSQKFVKKKRIMDFIHQMNKKEGRELKSLFQVGFQAYWEDGDEDDNLFYEPSDWQKKDIGKILSKYGLNDQTICLGDSFIDQAIKNDFFDGVNLLLQHGAKKEESRLWKTFDTKKLLK
jgi:hypothetical protein